MGNRDLARESLQRMAWKVVEAEAGGFHSPAMFALKFIDTILEAGWRPPARVIETAEDLDALPNESAIVIDRIAFQKFGGWWHSGREATPLHSEQLIDLHDSAAATLLWQPEVDRG